jgi:hypothetical protein
MRPCLYAWLVFAVAAAVCPARASGEPALAIAPVSVGQRVSAELRRAFSDELPRALEAAGFPVKSPNEIDLRVSERPEFLRCKSGPCLADEAAYLGVGRLLLPSLEGLSDGAVVIGAVLYDAALGRNVSERFERCAACTGDRLRERVRAVAEGLHHDVRGPEAPVPSAAVVVSPSPPPPARRGATAVTAIGVLKWVTLGAGLAAVGAGAGLWAIDGQGSCTLMGEQRQCPMVYDTMPVGASLVGVGGALLVTSTVLLAVDRRKGRTPQVGLLPARGGATLMVEGRFP